MSPPGRPKGESPNAKREGRPAGGFSAEWLNLREPYDLRARNAEVLDAVLELLAKPASTTAQASTSSDMTDGEVRKVDKEGGKLTLKHGDIKSLDMPGMTMVFSVKDKAVLGTLKAGDKVKFKAVNDAGKFTVTEVQVVK